MGQSTNAILFYGYCWDEERELDDALRTAAGIGDRDEIPEWGEILARQRGHVNPWYGYQETLDGETYQEQDARAKTWCASNRAQLDAWRAAVEAVYTDFEVDLSTHCSGDCPMPMLYVWSLTAVRGYPRLVDLPTPHSDWTAKLDRWLAEFGIEAPQDSPRFWLVSNWN